MDIVYLSGYDFRGFVRFRPQHLMTRLARRHRVLYVEPTRARKWCRPWRWGRLRREDGLLVLEPIVLPGLRWSRAVRRLNETLVRRAIRRVLRRHNFRDAITVVGTPFAAQIAGSLAERVVVYDCNDDWASIPRLPSSYLRRQEEQLARRADLVFATSRGLFSRLGRLNPRTTLLPSGVDVEHFAPAGQPGELPDEMRGLASPVIGSIGSINTTKDDLDILEAVAAQRPEWSFVFVGPVMSDVDLAKYPQLQQHARFLGARPYEALPAYVRAMNVCVLAYKRNAFTASANPTKVFEYLSAGKPVVATPLEDLVQLDRYVALAHDTDEFVAAIDAALDQDDRARQQARVERSRQRSWDAIVDAFETQLEHSLMEKQHGSDRAMHRLVQSPAVH